jgi:hypothetical protein
MFKRFYIFPFKLLRGEKSVGYLYFENICNVFNNNIIVNENIGLKIILLSILGDFYIPTNFISFIYSL